jgi:hypothetical protein
LLSSTQGTFPGLATGRGEAEEVDRGGGAGEHPVAVVVADCADSGAVHDRSAFPRVKPHTEVRGIDAGRGGGDTGGYRRGYHPSGPGPAPDQPAAPPDRVTEGTAGCQRHRRAVTPQLAGPR